MPGTQDSLLGWKPVRIKKTRQIRNLEPRFASIETEKAPGGAQPGRSFGVCSLKETGPRQRAHAGATREPGT